MARTARTSGALVRLLGDPPMPERVVGRYLKRLLIERGHIRARLENPGGSIILLGSEAIEQSNQYSSVIGNDFHLDLIEAEHAVNELPVADRVALLSWVDALNPKQAAGYLDVRAASVRRRAERKAKTLVESLYGQESGGAG